MKNLLLILFIAVIGSNVQAQKNAYKIDFIVPEMANEQLLIAYHYGNKQYISDTLDFDAKGKTAYMGDEPLHHGVYLAVFPKLNNKYFEFLVKEQFFSVEVKDIKQIGKPIFTNSPDNAMFYKDMQKMGVVRAQTEALDAKIITAKGKEKEKLNEERLALSDEFTTYRKELMTANPNKFYSDLLGMMREIEIPDSPKDAQGEEDKGFPFRYFRAHYWDFTDFTEEGIVRTPVFPNKLTDYFEKYTVKSQDSTMVSCDIVLEKAIANDKVFQYCLVTLVNKYANSKVMGDDAVYVHLVRKYYQTGKAWWTDPEQIEKMIERADALEPLLIGKTSPNLNLRDTTVNNFEQLHKVESDYTIVFIWDPDCGHCKKATPKLGKFYDAHKKDGIEVYAITTSNIENIQEWKDFIKEHNLNWLNVCDLYHQTNFRTIYDISSTPQVFILDKNKKIIAKRIGVEQIENFFHNYLKIKGDDRYTNFVLEDETTLPEGHDEHDGHNH